MSYQDRERIARLRARPLGEGEARTFFNDHTFGRVMVKVLPGEYYVTDEDMIVSTVLGSCVAVCLTDPGRRIAGMNHFLLPDGGGATGGRYGVYAMELLINGLMKAGARRHMLEAKVFGGAAVIRGATAIQVGQRNVAFVDAFLEREGIRVVARDVLGSDARKVLLFPDTGRVLSKRLSEAQPAIEEELRYGRRVAQAAGRAGAVELFWGT